MHGVPFAIKNSRHGFTKRFMNHYLMADGSRYTDKQGWETDDFVAETSNRDPRMLKQFYAQVTFRKAQQR